MTLWEKGGAADPRIIEFTVCDDPVLDRELVFFDCAGSVAHAAGLERTGLLSREEFEALKKELLAVIALHRDGRFEVLPEQEDVHTAVELHLTAKLGDLGKKLHAGRSRNDQVLTDLRLAAKRGLLNVSSALAELADRLIDLARASAGIPIPGYSHMRRAMPTTVGLWASAFVESLLDDQVLLEAAYRLMNQSPLGSAAGFGSTLGLDREFTAGQLGFHRVQRNPMYVQNSRGKLELAALEALGQIGLDLNRLAADLCLFSMDEFGFFGLPEAFTTGSSLMPHKRNPDVLELVRGKAHVLRADAARTASLVHNQFSGYNRDYQLTKRPFLEGMATCLSCLKIMTAVIQGLQVDEARCRAALTPELYAVDRVHGLVREGAPFRAAYRQVAGELREGTFAPPDSSVGAVSAPGDQELAVLYESVARTAGWAARQRSGFKRALRRLLGTDALRGF